MALATLGKIKATKGARKALSINFRLGRTSRYYKSDIRRAQKALVKLPDVLMLSFKRATGRATFVKGLKTVFANTAQAAASQVPLREATIRIREYMNSELGYPMASSDKVMVHSGRMLTDGIDVGATGKGKNFSLWVGFSARLRSPVPVKTPHSGLSYADVARRIESGFVIPIDSTVKELFANAGLKLNTKKRKALYVKPRPFMDKTARVTIQYIYDVGLKETEKEIDGAAAEVIPF